MFTPPYPKSKTLQEHLRGWWKASKSIDSAEEAYRRWLMFKEQNEAGHGQTALCLRLSLWMPLWFRPSQGEFCKLSPPSLLHCAISLHSACNKGGAESYCERILLTTCIFVNTGLGWRALATGRHRTTGCAVSPSTGSPRDLHDQSS